MRTNLSPSERNRAAAAPGQVFQLTEPATRMCHCSILNAKGTQLPLPPFGVCGSHRLQAADAYSLGNPNALRASGEETVMMIDDVWHGPIYTMSSRGRLARIR